jgi:four helix bundle protein
MKYQRFEDLPVWNDAIELPARLLLVSQAGRLNGVGDLKTQLERAAISISNNIAEGFERGTNNELINFLYIAKESSGEMRSMLLLTSRLPLMEDLAPEIDELLGRAENVSRQLGRWMESLKDSPYKGGRFQNSQTRQAAAAAHRRDQFLHRIREIQDEAMRRCNHSGDGRSQDGGGSDSATGGMLI